VPHPLITVITALTATTSAQHIEAALIAEYAATLPTCPAPQSRVSTALHAADPDLRAHLAAASPPTTWTFDTLVAACEALLPAGKTGGVFTPAAVADFMAAQAFTHLDATHKDFTTVTVMDPACGCGALLIAAARALRARSGEPLAVACSRLHGTDINADNIRRAHLLLELLCLAEADSTIPTPQLRTADALHTTPSTTYDVVLANPPYVRYQDLTPGTRADLSARWSSCSHGNFNLFFPFFELAEQLTSRDGVAVFITPNSFLTTASAAPLRGWLTDRHWLTTILDFGTHQVFDAMTYTAITVADHASTPAVTYLPVAGIEDLTTLDCDRVAQRGASYERLSTGPWRLVGRDDRDAIATIEAAGRALSQVADIRCGVATLRDGLYTLSGVFDGNGHYTTTYQGQTYQIEAELTRPVIKMAGMTADALATNTARILYPYVQDGSRVAVMSEEELRDRFPHAYTYLSAIRPQLARRDKGQKTYPTWYAYGRSQGLFPVGQCLLTPLYAKTPRFLPVPAYAQDAVLLNGAAVTGTDVRTEVLDVLLNSGVAAYYVSATSAAITGGYHPYSKSSLAGFGVLNLTDEQVSELASMPVDAADTAIADLYGIALPDRYRRSHTQVPSNRTCGSVDEVTGTS